MMPSPEAIEKIRIKMTRHGHANHVKRSPTYNTWVHLKLRCSNPKDHAWKWYGGRGIKVCPEWMKFENFLRDMGEKPDGRSIDRIDADKGYEPSNCRWATPKEQVSHLRPAVYSKTHCINGHLWIADNIYVSPKGRRQCGICPKIRQKKYQKMKAFPSEDKPNE